MDVVKLTDMDQLTGAHLKNTPSPYSRKMLKRGLNVRTCLLAGLGVKNHSASTFIRGQMGSE
jgi:hypothetical protein